MSVCDNLLKCLLTTNSDVSILVLVDVGLRFENVIDHIQDQECFNPCFSGCRSAIFIYKQLALQLVCFNPCFSGCRSAIKRHTKYCDIVGWFQSLF